MFPPFFPKYLAIDILTLFRIDILHYLFDSSRIKVYSQVNEVVGEESIEKVSSIQNSVVFYQSYQPLQSAQLIDSFL